MSNAVPQVLDEDPQAIYSINGKTALRHSLSLGALDVSAYPVSNGLTLETSVQTNTNKLKKLVVDTSSSSGDARGNYQVKTFNSQLFVPQGITDISLTFADVDDPNSRDFYLVEIILSPPQVSGATQTINVTAIGSKAILTRCNFTTYSVVDGDYSKIRFALPSVTSDSYASIMMRVFKNSAMYTIASRTDWVEYDYFAVPPYDSLSEIGNKAAKGISGISKIGSPF
jgi:hypothetical protein